MIMDISHSIGTVKAFFEGMLCAAYGVRIISDII